MRIQLEQIRDRPLEWQEVIVFTPETMGLAEMVAAASVEVAGKLAAVDGGYLLTMTLESELSLRCDRCLDEFPNQFDNRVEMLAVVEPEDVAAGEFELEERDLGFLHLDVPELDTEPLIYDQLQLTVPMSPKCSDECAGLCPQCGANRNREDCDCKSPADPRWRALTDE